MQYEHILNGAEGGIKLKSRSFQINQSGPRIANKLIKTHKSKKKKAPKAVTKMLQLPVRFA